MEGRTARVLRGVLVVLFLVVLFTGLDASGQQPKQRWTLTAYSSGDNGTGGILVSFYPANHETRQGVIRDPSLYPVIKGEADIQSYFRAFPTEQECQVFKARVIEAMRGIRFSVSDTVRQVGLFGADALRCRGGEQ